MNDFKLNGCPLKGYIYEKEMGGGGGLSQYKVNFSECENI